MDTRYKGIVLKLTDYKEADKLASIFTLEQGIISAKFTGVKKDKAKLKSVAQPFMFAEFNVNERNGLKTITSANVIDTFYNILSNYSKTICGYIVLDMIKSIIPVEKKEEDLFLLSLSSLKNIEEHNEYISLIDYILKFIDFTGMRVEFTDTDYVYLDKQSGEFTSSRTPNAIQIDKTVYKTLKLINDKSFDVEIENTATLKQITRLLHNIIYIKYSIDIKSFEFI